MEIVDWDALRENCAGDDSLMAELSALFCKEAPSMLADVASAVKRADVAQVKYAAHRLKGALSSMAAQQSLHTAAQLEAMASRGEATEFVPTYAQLEAEVTALLVVLTEQRAA